MNSLVTVVIPIYNVEQYLDRCILSIINQTYKNLEIILVDDGSPDRCPNICDAYAKKDPRVKVIHQENKGLGMARNTGIDHATGDYICFFDSDDYVEPDTIETCVSTAVTQGAELVIFGMDDVTPEGIRLAESIPCPPKSVFSGDEVQKILLPMSLYADMSTGEDWNILSSAWNKLYSMDVIRSSGWRFASERDIISEDFYSITELFGHLSRVCVVNRVLYHYTVNNASISRSYSKGRFDRIKVFYHSMVLLSKRMGLEDELDQPIRAVSFGLVIGAMKLTARAKLGFPERYREIKKILRDDCLQEWIRGTDYSGAGFQKKLLYRVARGKCTLLCFLMVYLKSRQSV